MKNTSFYCALLSLTVTVAFAQPRTAQQIKGTSWITYKVVHPLHEVLAKSASPEYTVVLDPTTKEIKSVTAAVDVTTFDSGNSNRDSHAMEVIDAIDYPEVEFTSTSITQTGDSLYVTGHLTFHGITKDITMAGTTQWQPNRLDVHGGFVITFTQFKLERPALLLIPVEDNITFTLASAFTWK
jgi:polyisoprenoid-binding protein YceI